MKDILGLRFAAFAMDYLVVFAFTGSYIRLAGEPMESGGYVVSGWPALLVPVFWLWWFVFFEWQTGVTLGKKIVGLRVERVDGRALTFGGAFLRRFCDIVDFWLSFGLVAVICHLKGEQGQRVGDLAAGTIVRRAKKKEADHIPETTAPGGRGPS